MQVPIECPRCGSRIDPVHAADGTRIICPSCSLDLASAEKTQSANRPAEAEHPELASSSHKIVQVRWISLAVFLISMAACGLLILQYRDRAFVNQIVPICGIIAIIAVFVWAYTGFALNLKSRTRSH